MMHPLAKKKVLIMGLGLHGGGVSVALWLARHGARVTVTDLKTKKQLASSLRQLSIFNFQFPIRFVLGRHRASDFRNADIVVQNPAVPRESRFLNIARAHGAQIENEATFFFKYCTSKNIIGVTGTRGKSTTCAMIAHILQRRFMLHDSRSRIRVWLAGNIRTTPMLSIVDRVKPDDWVVLELSSWHLENMGEQKMSPHIAVVTNVLDDHMNRYQSKRDYAREKENIVRYQNERDIAILNKENSWTRKMAHRTKARVAWFNNYQLPIFNFQISGSHNFLNAQAAAAAAHAVGVPKKIIGVALQSFSGLPDRQEVLCVRRGVTYVNDTTATTPDATIAALQRFVRKNERTKERKNIVLIAGGTDKNLNYKPLIPWITKTCKAVALLPGTATNKIMKLLVTRYSLRVTEVASMSEAVKRAHALAIPGDIVLLSPAAASFGLFQHEFDRGEQFRNEVRKLRNSTTTAARN